ncbi:hypothetical protein [Erythrobacter ani]|uniref:Uncharacterized protein n=1 Tax=Erythrobacter ani TaxID=2827235 RepID=A0ABS6SQJ3_9SPHN|nr:hypothetical protein [Erythrobacter ani]MBV7266737.1 hypothetical protein [Erythrobacter ani]
MTKLEKTLAKATLGTVAAGAMALATASPAMADDYYDRDRGIGAGEIIAGAVVIGGIAALAGAFDGDRDDYRDRRWRGRDHRGYNHRVRYDRGFNNGRRAVERCVRAAERQARRFGGYRFADVTQIRDVDRTRNGFRVKGRIQVEGGRGYGRRDFDRGRFTCFVGRGQRPHVEFRKIRGLR